MVLRNHVDVYFIDSIVLSKNIKCAIYFFTTSFFDCAIAERIASDWYESAQLIKLFSVFQVSKIESNFLSHKDLWPTINHM